MYTEPEIISTAAISSRCYVKVYIDGKRYRFYNGQILGINCNPNRSNSIKERDKALNYLCFQLKKKLELGWQPSSGKDTEPKQHVVQAVVALTILEASIKHEGLSEVYIRDLKAISSHFKDYLKENKLDRTAINKINSSNIDGFLSAYKSTATNYMNRRRALSSIFARLISQKMISSNPVQLTNKLREVPHLNLPYKKEQLQKVMQIIKLRNEQLYLCCLLMYGCMLRPHQEIRLLERGSFDDVFSKISLGGCQNKSRRNRTVPIPLYVQSEIKKQKLHLLADNINIFSKNNHPFNFSYFNTAWSRIKEDLLDSKLISQDHTLYSFRHTAAVNMYLKTKDPFKIQQAFGHSSLRVTLTYLRNLGLMVDSSLDDLPEFPG